MNYSCVIVDKNAPLFAKNAEIFLLISSELYSSELRVMYELLIIIIA